MPPNTRHSLSITLAVALILLTPPVVAAQTAPTYAFSVSASDTTYTAVTASPTGTLRPLYLWLLCASDGISALEVEIESSLPLLGFVPASGVFNVASASHLLLAIAGCPGTAPQVLGHWNVLDTGGTLCFGPLPLPVAVDCGTVPQGSPHMTVVGFASDGTTPCAYQAQGCTYLGLPIAIDPLSWGRIKTLYH